MPRAYIPLLALLFAPSLAAAQIPSIAAQERRQDAARRDRLDASGLRDTHNVALDEAVTGWPEASSVLAEQEPLLAVDGDPQTAWRGAPQGPWSWTLPLRRPVHLGLLRAFFGDAPDRGVPAAYRWEMQAPVGARCAPEAPWEPVPHGRRDDRDDNVFVHGPRDVHARRQALFVAQEVCALRLVVEAMDGEQTPVLRELSLLESSPSVLRGADVTADASWAQGPLGEVDPRDVVDGSYERFWAGAPDRERWELTVRLPTAKVVDRLGLTLGHDGVTTPLEGQPGRRYGGAHLPLAYTVETSYDDDPSHLLPLPEARNPAHAGEPLPVRRRLVHFSPRPVRLVRLLITRATGPWGEHDAGLAPVVRELSLHEASDPRPVVTPPLFFSVDANPAGLLAAMKGGEANADGVLARTLYHRLRRVLVGFDVDSRWTADASRPRDRGTGRFLEVIEGDDPQLDLPLLEAMSPPPALFLSGSFDWEFDARTGPWATRPRHWSWDIDAPASSPDRGMGQLRDVVQRRAAPLVGFCGGAQILAQLEAIPPSIPDDRDVEGVLDGVLMRNDNHLIRGLLTRPEPYERAWWYDPPELDARRPTILFDPRDALFSGLSAGDRASTRELPSSHGDLLRASAFDGPLRRLRLVAWSHFCRPWVDPAGLEATWVDPLDPERRCLLVPQAFRARDDGGYPLLGFQFHPEQRDFLRLSPGSPHEARGDAIELFSATIDLVLEAYRRRYWSRS